MGLKHDTTKSFMYAFEGIRTALKEEPNFRIHFAISFVALILAYILKLTKVEWLILLTTIFLVLVLELINTTLEALVDIVSPETHPKAKIAKDVAAAAVLLSAIFAVIVGAVLFFPKILSFL